MANIIVQNGQLPQGFCPSDYQSLLNAFSAQQFVAINTISSIVVSSTPPADHTVAWLQLDSLGRPTRLYFFAQGAWLSLHPQVPGATMLWNQALPDFTTFDGGDANAAPWSSISGQMWQLCATTLDGLGTQVLQAQFPVGVGSFANSGVPLPVALAATGGEDLHVLTQPEAPPHYHNEKIAVNRAVANGGSTDTTGGGGFVGPIADGGTELLTSVAEGDPATAPPGGVPVSARAHNNLPPYYVVYFLQRTNRLFYVVNP